MRFIDHFLDTQHGSLTKTTYLVNESDLKLIRKVFPDYGFKTYFPGFAVRVLCEQLKFADVTDLHSRIVHPTFSNIPDLVSRLEKAWRHELI